MIDQQKINEILYWLEIGRLLREKDREAAFRTDPNDKDDQDMAKYMLSKNFSGSTHPVQRIAFLTVSPGRTSSPDSKGTMSSNK